MPIQISLSTLDVYRSVAFKGDRVPICYFTSIPSPFIVEESSPAGTFVVETVRVPNSTTLYWRINHITTSSDDFIADSGSFTINNATGSFTISTALQAATEGVETFSVILSLTPGGSAIATSDTVSLIDLSVLTINDLYGSNNYIGTGNNSIGSAGSLPQTIISGVDLSTDGGLVWTFNELQHRLHFDTLRGTGATGGGLNFSTGIYDTDAAQQITSYNNNGFTVGTARYVNNRGMLHYSNSYRKMPKFVDIVRYTGNGASNRQIAHNLQSVPGFIYITREIDYPDGESTSFFHRVVGANSIILGSTTTTSTTYWSNTAPTSSVFTLGSSTNMNRNTAKFVAVLFAHNETAFGKTSGTGRTHVSFAGSYVGTGTTNQIDCGFIGGAKKIIIKRHLNSSGAITTGSWCMFDVDRGLYVSNQNYPIVNFALLVDPPENPNSAFSYYAGGFQLNGTADVGAGILNTVDVTYIFFAIGE